MAAQISQILGTKDKKGFSLIEVMIAMAIIGILAGIAVPHFMAHRTRAYDASSESSAKNAFIAAQVYFNDHPSGSISSVDTLIGLGFRPTSNVDVSVNGNLDTLTITAYHNSGDRTYTVNADGEITW